MSAINILLKWNPVISAVYGIIENQRQLHVIRELSSQVKRIGEQLDEAVLRDMRAGMQHLMDGMQTDIAQIREDDFREAHAKFNVLMSLDPNGETKGTSTTIKNTELISLGYWGNFYYFALRGDVKTSLIRLYEGVLKYPSAIGLFPEVYFNKNYCKPLVEYTDMFEQLSEQRRTAKKRNTTKLVQYYIKKGLHSYAEDFANHVVAPIVALTGGREKSRLGIYVWGMLDATQVQVPQYDDPKELEEAIQITQEKLTIITNAIREECQLRLDALKVHTIDELLQMSTATPKLPKKRTKTNPTE